MKTSRTLQLPPFYTQVIGSLPRPKFVRELLARREAMPAADYRAALDDVVKFATFCIIHKQTELARVWLRYHKTNFAGSKQRLNLAKVKKLAADAKDLQNLANKPLPDIYHPRTYLSGEILKQLSKDE